MSFNQFRERVTGRYKSVLPDLFFRRPLVMKNAVPLISFTFDDFPRSAFLTGGAILENHGISGTYYVSLGCMGHHGPSGELFILRDIIDLNNRGHELGCHTYLHLNAWETSTHDFIESIDQNGKALSEFLPGAKFRTLSYPKDSPRPITKRAVSKKFLCCRGGGQKLNRGKIDLSILHAYFLDKRRENLGKVINLIDENTAVRGWLIFATHDVCDNPTPYGCTPDYFGEIVRYSVKSGAIILPVARALELIAV